MQNLNVTLSTRQALRFAASAVALTSALCAGEAFAAAPPAPTDQPATPAAPAAAPAATAKRPAADVGRVARIVVKGNERIDTTTVLSYLPIQPGEVIDPARIDLALKTLYRTELFSDVQISLNGFDLVVQVAENPIVNQVVFEGNSNLTEDKLRDEVNIRPRGIFTRAKVQQDVQRIIELYRRSGRISATVAPEIVELPQKRVDLIFKIDEGGKTGVSRVNFIGNRAFSDDQLKGVVVTKESDWWNFFSSNDNFDPDRIDYDREQLRKFYANRGYYDFRVVSSVAELTPARDKFKINYTVDEGVKYTFGNLSVQTENAKLDPKVLERLLPIKSGQLYEADRIEQAVDAITFAAGSAGYAFVDIRPRETKDADKHTIDIVFTVREGPRVYVERIDIIGNVVTTDPVIRREFLLTEGDAYNRVLLDRSKNRVRALGFFKDVTIEEQPGSAPDKTVIQVKVEEQATGELSFSAGYSSIEKLVFDATVNQRNFRGQGEDVRLRLRTGQLTQSVELSITEPRFLNRNLAAGIDLYSYKYNFTSESAYQVEQNGVTFRTGYELNGYSRLQLHYTLSQGSVIVSQSYCDSSTTSVVYTRAICEDTGTKLTSLVGYTLSFNQTNDPLSPTRGWKSIIRQDFAGVGGTVNYLKNEAEATWYYGIAKDIVFSAKASGGYIAGWNGDSIRLNDRFIEGGNTFRGFQVAGVGPRDTTPGYNDALGAKEYIINSLELKFPNGLPEDYGIKTSWFTDFGWIGLLDEKYKVNSDLTFNKYIADSLAMRASTGLSVKWKSPMGPIVLDFADILAKKWYDKAETFRFSTATAF